MFAEQVANGITLGVTYGLLALGYTMVYGVLKFINFAHGDVFMVGAYVGIMLAPLLRFKLYWVMPAVMVAVALIGIVIEKVAYSKLRKAKRLNVMISAIGVSIILQNIILRTAGPATVRFPQVMELQKIGLGRLTLTSYQLVIVGSAAALLVALQFLVYRTKIGIAMRAASEDLETASLMGVDTNRLISMTFGIGSALAGAASVLVGMYFNAVFPFMGLTGGIKAFVAAVVGGIGSITGAVLGGLVMGLSEVMTVAYLSSSYRDAVAFVLLIGILFLRPSGLLGVQTKSKM